jgi:hypothetical protein
VLVQYRISGFLIADWFDVLMVFMEAANPHNLYVVPYDFEYVHIFFSEWSYILEPQQNEPRRKGHMLYYDVWSRLLGNLHE